MEKQELRGCQVSSGLHDGMTAQQKYHSVCTGPKGDAAAPWKKEFNNRGAAGMELNTAVRKPGVPSVSRTPNSRGH